MEQPNPYASPTSSTEAELPDDGKLESGWWALLTFIAVVGLLVIVINVLGMIGR